MRRWHIWRRAHWPAAAITATIGASAGYYATAYVSAALEQPRRGPQALAVTRAMSNVFALRRIVIEFGPAELIDNVAVRPLTFYMGPLMFGNVIAGWIFGKARLRRRVLSVRGPHLRAIQGATCPAN